MILILCIVHKRQKNSSMFNRFKKSHDTVYKKWLDDVGGCCCKTSCNETAMKASFGHWQVVVVTSKFHEGRRFVCKHSPTTQTRSTSGLSHIIHFFTNSFFDKQQVAEVSSIKPLKKKRRKQQVFADKLSSMQNVVSGQGVWVPTTPPLSMIKNTEMAKNIHKNT